MDIFYFAISAKKFVDIDIAKSQNYVINLKKKHELLLKVVHSRKLNYQIENGTSEQRCLNLRCYRTCFQIFLFWNPHDVISTIEWKT